MREPIPLKLLLELTPRADHALPKARQLYLNLYRAIESGALPYDSQLPPSRQLASLLNVGRNLAVQVYEQLANEGLVKADGRRGTRVIRKASKPTSKQVSWHLSARSTQPRSRFKAHRALAPGEPDTHLFPSTAWRRALATAARLDSEDLGYQATASIGIREAITRYLATYRSVAVDPEQIIITSSTRQSLVLAACLYADPGDTAWVECPGYTGAVDAFQQCGLQVKACALDTEGLISRDWRESPRIVYLTPCFQYPMGMSLGAERRDELIRQSMQRGCVLFEDDYDSEFRDDSQPRPALFADASDARVLHAGTFSKILFPAVRVAWLVVPRAHAEQANYCLRAIGGGNTTVAQTAVAELMQNGTVARHLQHARNIYGQRRQRLLEAIQASKYIESTCDVTGSLSLVLQLKTRVPLTAINNALKSHGLGAQPLEQLEWNKKRPTRCRALVIGLGSVDSMALPSTVAKLDKAVASAANQNR